MVADHKDWDYKLRKKKEESKEKGELSLMEIADILQVLALRLCTHAHSCRKCRAVTTSIWEAVCSL